MASHSVRSMPGLRSCAVVLALLLLVAPLTGCIGQRGDGPSDPDPPRDAADEAERGESPPTADAEPGEVGISAVRYNAPGNDHENKNGEWVEIINGHDDEVDMTGWTLEDEADHAYAFPDGFVLDSGATVTVFTGEGTDTGSELYWGSDIAIWNNGGDTAYIYDDDGSLVDKYAW